MKTWQTFARTRLAGWTVVLLLILAPTLITAADDEISPKRVQTAIDGGLEWLAKNQIKDGAMAGSWECTRYHTAVASLAGLAFLANGYRPGAGEYGAHIDRAMKFVQASMTPEGYLGARDQQMYVHAICTLFGLSYLGTSENPEQEKELAAWCRKSLKLIERAQNVRKPAIARGGWRYSPDTQASDLSVTSWMLLVLHAARQAGFEVDGKSIDAGLKYVDRAFREREDVIRDKKGKVVSTRQIRGFLYRAGTSTEPERAATGVAVFVKTLLEGETDAKIEKSLELLTANPPDWEGDQYNGYFFFASFYITQGMFQIGGEPWRQYASQIKRELVNHQGGDGDWGFPQSNKHQSREAGKGYATAMAILILSLEKQYLPMYQRQRKLF